MKNFQDRKSNSTGFTLVELMLVTSIILVVSAIVVPIFGGFWKGYSIKGVSRNLFVMAKKARISSGLYNMNYRIKIDFDNNKIWLESEEVIEGETLYSKAKGYGEPLEIPKNIVIKAITIKEPTKGLKTYSEEKCYIYFTPDGYADESLIFITSRVDKKEKLFIHIESLSMDPVFYTQAQLKSKVAENDNVGSIQSTMQEYLEGEDFDIE